MDGILEIIKQEVEAREISEGVKVQEERKQILYQQDWTGFNIVEVGIINQCFFWND